MEYTIKLTEVQDKALKHVAYNPQEWIENVVYERCRLAIEEIALAEFQKLLMQEHLYQEQKKILFFLLILNLQKNCKMVMINCLH